MRNSSVHGRFVLVHGAFHGGWCWRKLTPLLRAAGHEVFTPTLTGLGERSHLLNAQVGLNTHIEDVTSMLEHECLDDVILVGHSYAGMVITGVADRVGARISQLIYLDAFVPVDGEAVQDYMQPPPAKDGWRIPPLPPQSFGIMEEGDVAWLQRLLSDQPLKTFEQRLQLTSELDKRIKCSFIQCSDVARLPILFQHAERAKQQGFRCRTLLFAGHEAMITQPEKLAEVLLELL